MLGIFDKISNKKPLLLFSEEGPFLGITEGKATLFGLVKTFLFSAKEMLFSFSDGNGSGALQA